MSKICPLDGRKTNCTDNCNACLEEEQAKINSRKETKDNNGTHQ